MTEFRKFNTYPDKSLIAEGMESIDYCDSYMTLKRTGDSIDQITARLFALPSWVRLMLKIRYIFIARPFGLSTGTKNDTPETSGSFFKTVPVISRNRNEIVMGEDDRHLYFRISVMKRKSKPGIEIYLTTVVKFHNIWGRIYFLPVKPFHKIVVKSMLKRL